MKHYKKFALVAEAGTDKGAFMLKRVGRWKENIRFVAKGIYEMAGHKRLSAISGGQV